MLNIRPLIIATLCFFPSVAWGQGTTIDFERGAPTFFFESSPVSNEYSSLGVTFSGDSGAVGGSVLNMSTFAPTVGHSGTDALAFSPAYTGMAERIEFSNSVRNVSLWGTNPYYSAGSISLSAYDAKGNLLQTVTGGGGSGEYSQISISNVGHIKYVVISAPSAPFMVIDDLYFLSWLNSENTKLVIRASGQRLHGVMDRRLSQLAFMTDYDCASFNEKGYCISFQARYSKFDSMNEGAGVLTAAYRLTNNFHIGSFIDYRASEKEPIGFKSSNGQPTFGAFAGYAQNPNGTGLQAKVLAAFQRDNMTITREGSEGLNTEPGSGKGRLNSYVVSGELGWGFAVSGSMLSTPYIGVRYTDSTRSSYNELTVSGAVEYPVSYNDYYHRLTTATAGVRIAGMMTDKIGYQIGAGVEHDLRAGGSTYSGTSSITGLESFALNVDGVNNRTRGVGSVGMFYQFEKSQRLTGNISFRNQAYTSQNALSVMAGYQVAF